eukprot:TRINITY_DN76702_c0_g1_i1.p1 TRINITY_DN76702_c0_g1~~TRINITY_DN76702_c0_g1_i1.p1  ORF type:complete len:259 (-),score=20.92 TRINITY_DN76702_c0_g1_i1:134-877(-)
MNFAVVVWFFCCLSCTVSAQRGSNMRRGGLRSIGGSWRKRQGTGRNVPCVAENGHLNQCEGTVLSDIAQNKRPLPSHCVSVCQELQKEREECDDVCSPSAKHRTPRACRACRQRVIQESIHSTCGQICTTDGEEETQQCHKCQQKIVKANEPCFMCMQCNTCWAERTEYFKCTKTYFDTTDENHPCDDWVRREAAERAQQQHIDQQDNKEGNSTNNNKEDEDGDGEDEGENDIDYDDLSSRFEDQDG